jgi:SsrA-binding protein
MKKKKGSDGIVNRRASFEYELGEDLVVGLELTGAEVKAARMGHVQLKGSYVAVKHEQLWLINASFSVKSSEKGSGNTVDTRDRRILAHRRQIERFIERKKAGMSIVPKRLLNKGKFIKLVIAEGRGKKLYDKRQAIKTRDLERRGE